MIQQITSDKAKNYHSLSLAISKLFDKQEKGYGCFQVQKEGEFFSLNIPTLPSFKFYQNPKSLIYRGYWRNSKGLPKPTDTRAFPPDLWIRKKQKQVEVDLTSKSTKEKKEQEPSLLNQPKTSKPKPIIKKKPTIDLTKITTAQSSSKRNLVQKKQRIYEIVYRYNPCSEVMQVNQVIALSLKEQLISTITEVPESEIFPLVLVANPE